MGQLGYGPPADTSVLGDDEVASARGIVPVNGFTPIAQVAVAEDHTCVLLRTGTVRCFGANRHGCLGYNSNALEIGLYETPESAGDVRGQDDKPLQAMQVAVTSNSTCILAVDGNVMW